MVRRVTDETREAEGGCALVSAVGREGWSLRGCWGVVT